MEPVERTLRQVLGRTRYGLYAFQEDGSPPRLLAASPHWPPPEVDPIPILEQNPWLEGAPLGRLTPVAGMHGVPRAAAAKRAQLAVLAVGEPGHSHGGLLLQAGARSPLWDWPAEDWSALGSLLDAFLQKEQMRRSFDALRGFHEVLLDSLPLGVLAIDAIGRVTFLSRPAEAILGYGRQEALGADCTRIFHPAGVEENPLIQGLRGKETRVELYITDRDGNEKPVWLQMARIPAPPPEKTRGLLVLIRDTTEDRAYEEERRRRERLASIGELSAGVAHEIRNPLTGIGNCAQVLRERIASEDPLQKMVTIILDESARLNRIVESLLSFARPGRPQLREWAVIDSVRHVIELEQGRLGQHGITAEVRVRGRIPAIFIDPDQITQVLLNVVRNAADAMPKGGRLTVEVSVVRRRPHLRRGTGQRKTDRIRYDRVAPLNRYVRVQVTDTGEGIPRDTVPRIFDPFFTTRSKGTGLGLSISQSIVTEHAGFISLHSIEKKGTAISIDLPVERRQGERRRRGA
jgi:PAS domain S-box-containing protein